MNTNDFQTQLDTITVRLEELEYTRDTAEEAGLLNEDGGITHDGDLVPYAESLHFDRLHILTEDAALTAVSSEARELHNKALKLMLGKPSCSYLTMCDLDRIGATMPLLRELEENLLAPVWFSNLGIPAGYSMLLLNVLCGWEEPEDMPWHPNHKE